MIQEQHNHINIYALFQKLVYTFVTIDCVCLFFLSADIPFLSDILNRIVKIKFIFPPLNAKFSTLVLIILVGIATKARKDENLNVVKSIIIPLFLGLLLMFTSPLWSFEAQNNNLPKLPIGLNKYQLLYGLFSFLGAVITQVGADNASKYIRKKLGKDRYNVEEESFEQNRTLVKTDTSINIPYIFKYKNRNNKGWININPFRGTMVIGVPGSGKSFGVINPSIRQMISKGFCICLYDFKYPDLSQIAYHHYLLKRQKDKNYKHKFHVINLNNVEESKRINPFKKEYISTLAEAQEMAESMVSSLQKGGGGGGGSDQFFTQSAINFLASCIYFFATYENGKYSYLPHILSFLNHSYEEIFDVLFSHEELESLLSPFKTAYQNKIFEQLEGQIGTLKVFISRLATKESFWIFSGDDINLKISSVEEPSILVLASDPSTQDINSALYSAVLNRILKLINSKGNLPVGIIADEFPTIYIHKIDNIIATARSNKVAVLLGLQELPQLRQFYKKEIADTISSIIGNVLSGAVRDKHTLDWLEKLLGKIKQKSYSQSISQQGTSTSINEKMDLMIPAGKIANLKTGEMIGIIAQDDEMHISDYKTSAVSGKINLNMKNIKTEEKNYVEINKSYEFKNSKEDVLMTNFRKINKEVNLIIENFVKH